MKSEKSMCFVGSFRPNCYLLYFLFRLEVAAPGDGAFGDEALHGETLVIDETSEEGQYAVVVRLSGAGGEVDGV